MGDGNWLPVIKSQHMKVCKSGYDVQVIFCITGRNVPSRVAPQVTENEKVIPNLSQQLCEGQVFLYLT
mgnify:CR=1 FL=1